MNTPLTSTSMTEEELQTSPAITEDEILEEEEEAHIHLPGPSLWPALLAVAILLVFVGVVLFGTPAHNQLAGAAPWFVFIGLPLVLIGIMGWALENPHGQAHGAHARGGRYAASFADASVTGKPTVFAAQTLDQAEAVVEGTVTIGSTAWSAHPVKVFVEREGVVLSLYGKVELEAQKKEVEAAVRQVPGVLDVMNFLVAEDELLNAVNAAIEGLQAAGKLEGATDISVLVENGIVSLYGNVPSTSMKYLLEREISGIPGARVVVNHIGLNKDIPGNLGKTTNRIARI
ncbi:MAG TPA: BON domain-containing protein [Ktedonobacteraceae bacterium]|nr:BON domain-containing protein [Ktedonobacteraceae bacterium]